jgi:uncharacterized membrane protein YvbJ
MVYCTKCGTKNPDDAKVCSNCGASLNPVREEREHYRRRYESECFGIPRAGTIVAIAIGLIIVLGGLIVLLQEANLIPKSVDVGPFALIIFGILILIGAFYAMRRRY